MIEEITMTKGDDKGTIESLINYLEEAKKKGATHYKICLLYTSDAADE